MFIGKQQCTISSGKEKDSENVTRTALSKGQTTSQTIEDEETAIGGAVTLQTKTLPTIEPPPSSSAEKITHAHEVGPVSTYTKNKEEEPGDKEQQPKYVQNSVALRDLANLDKQGTKVNEDKPVTEQRNVKDTKDSAQVSSQPQDNDGNSTKQGICQGPTSEDIANQTTAPNSPTEEEPVK